MNVLRSRPVPISRPLAWQVFVFRAESVFSLFRSQRLWCWGMTTRGDGEGHSRVCREGREAGESSWLSPESPGYGVRTMGPSLGSRRLSFSSVSLLTLSICTCITRGWNILPKSLISFIQEHALSTYCMPGTSPGTWATLIPSEEVRVLGHTLNRVVRGGPIENVPLCDFLVLQPGMARSMSDELFTYK